MEPGVLAALLIPWWSAAGMTSLLAERAGFSAKKWFFASLFTGPVSWINLYVRIRDRRERVGPGPRRSGSLSALRTEGRRRGKTIS